MKKNLLLVAMIATTLITSCIKEDNPGPQANQESTVLTVKINPSGYEEGTRATADSIPRGELIAVKTGMLYLTDANGQITNALVVIPTTSTAPGDNHNNVRYDKLISPEGVQLTGMDPNAGYVFFFGNISSEFMPMPNSGAIGAIITNMVTMMSQTDQNGGVANVSLYGTGGITNGKITLKITPITARLQIPKLKAEGAITGFRLEGIFLNNFYHCTKMNGVPNGGDLEKYDSDHPFEQNMDLDNPSYYSPYYEGCIYDWNTTQGLGAFSPTVPTDYLPTNGQTWAYNVFGGGEVPHLVFVFTNITATPASGLTYTGTWYVTVKGFRDSGGNALTSLVNGKTYTFTDGIAINEENLLDTPEGTPGSDPSPHVDVSETPWDSEQVAPIH